MAGRWAGRGWEARRLLCVLRFTRLQVAQALWSRCRHVRQSRARPDHVRSSLKMESQIFEIIISSPRPRLMATAATIEYASSAPTPLQYPRLPKHHLLPSNTPDYIKLILNAKVYEILQETPLVLATNLSAKLGNQIYLKREDLQEVFSFKIRGAFNFMASLSDEERWKGVVTCSAG